MSNNKKIICLSGLLVLLTFSFLIFFGLDTTEKTNIEISSFIFILLTEFLVIGNVFFVTTKKINNTFTVAGISSLTFLYTIISLMFNIFFIDVFSTLRGNLVFNFSILLIYLFISLVIFFFKKEEK